MVQLAAEKPRTGRVPCPECHRLHTVDRRVAGAYLWNVCPACLAAGDRLERRLRWLAAEDFGGLCREVLLNELEARLHGQRDRYLKALQSPWFQQMQAIQDLYEVAAERGRLSTFEHVWGQLEQELEWGW